MQCSGVMLAPGSLESVMYNNIWVCEGLHQTLKLISPKLKTIVLFTVIQDDLQRGSIKVPDEYKEHLGLDKITEEDVQLLLRKHVKIISSINPLEYANAENTDVIYDDLPPAKVVDNDGGLKIPPVRISRCEVCRLSFVGPSYLRHRSLGPFAPRHPLHGVASQEALTLLTACYSFIHRGVLTCLACKFTANLTSDNMIVNHFKNHGRILFDANESVQEATETAFKKFKSSAMPTYFCLTCSKFFGSAIALYFHLAFRPHMDNKYLCPICKMYEVGSLREHIVFKHPEVLHCPCGTFGNIQQKSLEEVKPGNQLSQLI